MIQIISEEDKVEEEGDDVDQVADENEEDEYIDLNNAIKDEKLTSQVVNLGAGAIMRNRGRDKKEQTNE